MWGANYLIHKVRAKLSEGNDILSATLDPETAPIIMATQPRYKPNRVATIETVKILTAIMPAEEWMEIEERVTG